MCRPPASRRCGRCPSVKEVIPDDTVPVGDPEPTGPTVSKATAITSDAARSASKSKAAAPDAGNPFPTANNCGTIDNPLIEPEALTWRSTRRR